MMLLYVPRHSSDQGIIWNHHLPGTRQTETCQGSTEEKQLCRCPPSPHPGCLHFLYATGDLTEAPGSMKSLPRECYCQLLSPESKQSGKVNRTPPVTRNALDFARTEDLSVTPETNENDGKMCCSLVFIHV